MNGRKVNKRGSNKDKIYQRPKTSKGQRKEKNLFKQIGKVKLIKI